MRFYVFFLTVSLSLLSGWNISFGESRPSHDPIQEKAQNRPESQAKGSPELEAARARIKRMMDWVDGTIFDEEAAKAPSTSILRPRKDLALEITQNLLASLDHGPVSKAIFNFLVGNEAYTDQEHKDVFVNKFGEDLLSAIQDSKEKQSAVYEYTQARQILRLKLLKEVQEQLKLSSDPRAYLLAEAIRRAIPGSQLSYEEALRKIKAESLTRPICFSCGEPVSLNPDYDFYTAMDDIAQEVATALHLSTNKATNKVPAPFFDTDREFFTFDGKTMFELQDEKGDRHQVDVKNGSLTYAVNEGQAKNLTTQDPRQKKLMQLRTDFINSGVKSQRPSSKTTSSNDTPSKPVSNQASNNNSVQDFLSHHKASHYPRADNMATALGLVDSAGQSLLIHKNAHWDKTAQYGIIIRWDAIEKLEPTQQAQVYDVLSTVKSGSLSDWKVVNGNQGHCLWCHLNNDPESLQNLKNLKARIEKNKPN